VDDAGEALHCARPPVARPGEVAEGGLRLDDPTCDVMYGCPGEEPVAD
jgi:hypothetical protein